MKTKEELIKELGNFYTGEKDEIESVIEQLKDLMNTTVINEETINALDSCETSIRVLKWKYVNRLMKLYLSGVKL